MHIVLIAAMSQDGFITNQQGSYAAWTSEEDKAFFTKTSACYKFGVKGINTHLASPLKPNSDRFRIVLTQNPDEVADQQIPGVLEFHKLSPQQFVEKFADQPNCLLLGGSRLFTDFLVAGLVNEAFLTIEPVKLHNGLPILRDGLNIRDYFPKEKAEITPLNDRGTLLEHHLLI